MLAWIAQSPIIIITGEQLRSSYEYRLLQVPIFGALIAGNLLLARLTSRRTVRSLDYYGRLADYYWSVGRCCGNGYLIARVFMDDRSKCSAFGIGLANAGLVQLTLFASDMSKGTVSAAMGMLQMLIFTVGIEISERAWLNGGNELYNLFNLVNGILWLSLMVIFLKDKQMGNSHEG